MKWPLQSLDLSPCDFFLWGYVKGLVYISPLPASIDELRESLPHWIILLETCYSMFGKRLTTILTCAVSLVVHLLNIYEIGPRIKLWYSTPKLLNFIELDLVVFKIIAFKMMSNFFGHSVYILIRSTYILNIFWYKRGCFPSSIHPHCLQRNPYWSDLYMSMRLHSTISLPSSDAPNYLNCIPTSFGYAFLLFLKEISFFSTFPYGMLF